MARERERAGDWLYLFLGSGWHRLFANFHYVVHLSRLAQILCILAKCFFLSFFVLFLVCVHLLNL